MKDKKTANMEQDFQSGSLPLRERLTFSNLLFGLLLTVGGFTTDASSSTTRVSESSRQPEDTFIQSESAQTTNQETELTKSKELPGFLGHTDLPDSSTDTASVNARQSDGQEKAVTEDYSRDEKNATFFIDLNECSEARILEFTGLEGKIYGKSGGQNRSRTTAECAWTLRGPEGFQLCSSVDFPLKSYLLEVKVTVVSDLTGCERVVFWSKRIMKGLAVVVSSSNQQYFQFSDSLEDKFRTLEFEVRFRAVPVSENVLHTLPIVFTSPSSGYVTSYGFEEGLRYPCGTNATRLIAAPEGQVMMTSLATVHLVDGTASSAWFTFITMYQVNNDGTLTNIQKVRSLEKEPTFLQTNLLLHLKMIITYTNSGFKMLFSFHPVSEAPRKLVSGLWDCSVPHYNTFKQHLDCNLEKECQGGEDEGAHCTFSSPACNGSVAVGDKCYEYVESDTVLSGVRGSSEECSKRGGKLAVMKSREEWDAFLKLFQYGKRRNIAIIGLRTSDTHWPKYYKYTLVWADGTMSYETNTTQEYFQGLSRRVCGFYEYMRPWRSVLTECVTAIVKNVICEYPVQVESSIKQNEILFPTILDPILLWDEHNKVKVIQCPGGHMTHVFSSCDPKSFCGKTGLPVSCRTATSSDVYMVTQMFVCDDHLTSLPYTLVCDFRPDCLDASDESFCKHDRKCQEFTCRSGQCISKNKYCDLYRDCWDGSDEICTSDYFYEYPAKFRLFAPAVIYFDGEGEFYQMSLTPYQPCPPTHFRCAGESAYCLPVYVRCNGVYDCPSHEDEDDCQRYTCPGFYRCRASSVCVHADNVCDGWPQCPQHDDEAFCGLSCPETCVCQGFAFVCREPFPAKDHPDIRYLDGTGSGMTLYDVVSNTYLVWLSLASCGLQNISDSQLPNLQVLDLSDNKISTVDLHYFRLLRNLKTLRLARNPIVSLRNSGFAISQDILQMFDVSQCLLTTFDSQVFREFPHLRFLNISSNNIKMITDNRFVYLPTLSEIDMRKNPLELFPQETLKNLKHLDKVFADNYKLCCEQNLPDLFDVGSCFAPEDEISSCDDLLRSDVYRIFLWLFCAMSISGNAGSFLFRQFYGKRQSVSGFGIFVTSLSVSDFLMGVYLAIIGAADEIYRATYLWHDVQWKVSVTCKVAGFLSFLSSEVSALIICLITLDRFIVLRFPFSNLRFDSRSASWACGLAWVVGLALAGVPFLPFFSHWEFYGQNGICIPLPITRKAFSGRSYSFGVMIIFNMILFVFIAFGQICIYWSVRMNSMQTNTTKKSKDIVIARRLATVVVSDFLCWFPIGLVSIMAASGIAVPGEVSVVMIIFVLPLNASLNPFLYTFNLMIEKWRQAEEARLIKRLECQLTSDVLKLNSSDLDSSVANVV